MGVLGDAPKKDTSIEKEGLDFRTKTTPPVVTIAITASLKIYTNEAMIYGGFYLSSTQPTLLSPSSLALIAPSLRQHLNWNGKSDGSLFTRALKFPGCRRDALGQMGKYGNTGFVVAFF